MQNDLFQCNSQASDCVIVWATLKSRKNSLIDFIFIVIQHLQEIRVNIFIWTSISNEVSLKQIWWIGRRQLTSLPCLLISLTPFLKKIMAPRGPRSDLWVVVVTTSAYSNGEGTTPAATSPLICAISASKIAFCLSHTCQRHPRNELTLL